MIRWTPAAFLMLAGTALAQAPKNVQAGNQSTTGSCSPAVVAGANVTITCQNLDPALVGNLNQVLARLNRIAATQLDQKAVTRELDEIKALVSHGTVSSATIEEGVAGGIGRYAEQQRRQMEQEQNNPHTLAQSSYKILSKYLGMLKSMTPAMPAATDPASLYMAAFHKFDLPIADTLEKLQARNLPVGDLVALSKRVNTLDDVRRLADGFKRIDESRAHALYMQLARFLAAADSTSPNSQAQIYQNLFAQQVQMYRTSYSDTISENLSKLKAQNVNVDDLIAIQTRVATLDDIQRLADGFKKLADSLPQ